MSRRLTNQDIQQDDLRTITNAYTVITKVTKFSNEVNLSLFKYIFEERGEHYAELWRKCNGDYIRFTNQLDDEAKQILFINIFYNEHLYAYTR